jgi:DNA-binding NtrC family response regulator
MIVWMIDDDPGHLATAAATVKHLGWTGFRGFLSGHAALAARQSGEALPEVLLMDFYINGERGDAVTRQWRAGEAPGQRTCIVGHSSMRSGSEAIVAAGGDAIVRKRRSDDGLNHDLLAWLGERAG